jgi:hypothetical protein
MNPTDPILRLEIIQAERARHNRDLEMHRHIAEARAARSGKTGPSAAPSLGARLRLRLVHARLRPAHP